MSASLNPESLKSDISREINFGKKGNFEGKTAVLRWSNTI